MNFDTESSVREIPGEMSKPYISDRMDRVVQRGGPLLELLSSRCLYR